jgi:hypothetical protein
MILPDNGKIVIIDDVPGEVEQLMSALTKEKMPSLFFHDQGELDLPDEPIKNVRLVFLDLDLGIGGNDPKQKIRIIQQRLTRILIERTPYVLIIWSNHEDRYKEFLLQEFEGDFKLYKPVAHCSLDKSILKQNEINIIDGIRESLKKQLVSFKSFNAFLIWESIVNDASGKMTNEIASLYPPDNDWDSKTKFILYKLAHAYSGKAVNGFDTVRQLKNALYTLTQTFTDYIENSIDTRLNNEFENLVSNSAHNIENVTVLINKLLLISESNDKVTQPGNVFFPFPGFDRALKENEEWFFSRMKTIPNIPAEKQEAAIKSTKLKYEHNKELISEKLRKWKSNFNEIVVSALVKPVYENEAIKKEILDNFYGIELNITPLCDYAQEKAKMFRILPGAILKSQFRKFINIYSAYTYISDADFIFEGEGCFLYFDLRFLYSLDIEEMQGRFVHFRLKHQILSDIQVKLGSHINRAGVIFLYDEPL